MTPVLLAAAVFVACLALWKPFPQGRKRFRSALVFLLLFAASLAVTGPEARQIAAAFLELAALQAVAGLLLAILYNRVRLPRFKVEVIVVAGYAAILFRVLSVFGVNLTGIFATSAIATAIVGLALQDMLGNIAGGLALQFEREIHVGDFIKIADNAGWVRHVRLRHTAIETSDGDRILIPNSFLVRTAVNVVSKTHRMFLPFALPYTHNPHDVTTAVAVALGASPLPGVAAEPAPGCMVRELAPGHIQYAAVVWLTEPGRESTAVSGVLTRLYFALQRAGIPVAEIAGLLEVKRAGAPRHERFNPMEALRATPIFRQLGDESLSELGAHLRSLSFAPGEFVLRQGEPGDSMYFINEGEVAITVTGTDAVERTVATIAAGDFLGEGSLLTGAARNANAIALTRVDCFRLDKAGLQGLMTRLPELAEDISVVIAHRQMELDGVRQAMDRETALRRETESQGQLLARIRKFFDLGETE